MLYKSYKIFFIILRLIGFTKIYKKLVLLVLVKSKYGYLLNLTQKW